MTMYSAEEFRRLRLSEDMAEYNKAAHDDALIEVWYDVIERYPDLRKWVAHNKTVPLEILAVLAKDPDVIVRSTVAGKRKLTPDLLRELMDDPNSGVRGRVVRHPKAPRDVLEHLTNDSWDVVRDMARDRLSGARPDLPVLDDGPPAP